MNFRPRPWRKVGVRFTPIAAQNKSSKRKAGSNPANFSIYYEADDMEIWHDLQLNSWSQTEYCGWVLLDREL
jgi:hypothetical protein